MNDASPKPVCIGCNQHPEQISEYVMCAAAEELTPDEYVCAQEGTYNPLNGHFVCTSCYFKMGQPSLPYPKRWVAP